MRKALDEFDAYIAANQIVSKRFAKRQQMQWTKKRAHLLLPTRT